MTTNWKMIPIPFPQLPLSHYDLQLRNTKKKNELYESKFLAELTTQKSVLLVPYRGKPKIPEPLRISHPPRVLVAKSRSPRLTFQSSLLSGYSSNQQTNKDLTKTIYIGYYKKILQKKTFKRLQPYPNRNFFHQTVSEPKPFYIEQYPNRT